MLNILFVPIEAQFQNANSSEWDQRIGEYKTDLKSSSRPLKFSLYLDNRTLE